MIWLSDAALRYAADICYEKNDYSVIIFVLNPTDTEDVKRKLKTFTKNKHATIREGAWLWHVDFENESCIKIVHANDNVRENRCHLAIVSEDVSDTVIDNIIQPTELRQRTNRTDETTREPAIENQTLTQTEPQLYGWQDVTIDVNDYYPNIQIGGTTTAAVAFDGLTNIATTTNATTTTTNNVVENLAEQIANIHVDLGRINGAFTF